MGTDTKQNIVLAIKFSLIVLTLLSMLLLLVAFYAPLLAARNVFSPTLLLTLPAEIMTAYVLFCLFGIVCIRFDRETRKSGFILVLVALMCLSLYAIAGSRRAAGDMFLAATAARIRNDCSAQVLNSMFSEFQGTVRTGKQAGSVIVSTNFPLEVRDLYKPIPPVGNLLFSDKDLFNLEIRWGGSTFSWGIELFSADGEQSARSGKALVRPVYSNALVFIGN